MTSSTSGSYQVNATVTNGQIVDFIIDPNGDDVNDGTHFTATIQAQSPIPVITAPPQSQSVFVGNTATFSVTASGTPPMFYQWQFNSGTLTDATNSILILTNVQLTYAGDYRVLISNAYGSATSSVAALTVRMPPLGQAFTNGGFEFPELPINSTTGFAAGATNLIGWTIAGGTAVVLDHRWPDNFIGSVDGSQYLLFNAGDRATGSTISQTFATEVGQTYLVRFSVGRAGAGVGSMQITATVTASNGNVLSTLTVSQVTVGWGAPNSLRFTATSSTSTLTFQDTSAATLTVDVALDAASLGLAPAVLTAQPQSQVVSASTPALMNASAEGSVPLQYQWYLNGNNPIANATNPTLSIPNARLGNAGNYFVVVSNAVGSVTSSVATLTVLLCAPSPTNLVIADSVSDFSGIQGQGNWYYGYFDGDSADPYGPGDFEPLITFDGTWHLQTGPGGCWTALGAAGGQPNSLNFYQSRIPALHWAVRRWVSPVSGPVTISGFYSACTGGGGGCDGGLTRIAIYVNGTNLWEQTVNSSVTKPYAVSLTLAAGDLVDFVIDPNGDDVNDGTHFTAQINATVSNPCPSWTAPPPGLVSWWPGDGNANDVVGGMHGVLQGTATANATGVVAGAFGLAGTNSYVSVPYDANHPLFNLTNKFTYELWVKPDTAGALIDRHQCDTANPSADLMFFTTNGAALALWFGLNAANGADWVAFKSAQVVIPGSWYHVAATYDRDAQQVRLYLNGTNLLSGTYTQSIWKATTPLWIGGVPKPASNPACWESFLRGQLDEVSIYNRALSADEIAAIYAAGAGGKSKMRLLLVSAQGSGSVTKFPDKPTYLEGETVTLTASPGRYSAFAGWSDGVTRNPRVITISASNSYTAVFTNTVPLEELVFNQWDKSFGGSAGDAAYDIKRTSDGGFIVVGESASAGMTGNKYSSSYGGSDIWILRLDAEGNKLWEKALGGSADDRASSVVETADHGLLIGGESMSGVSGTKTSPNYGSLDYWIIRLDANGNQLWDKSFGGNSTEQLRSLVLTADGGIVLGGESGSGVSGNKSSPGFGAVDYWVVRLDPNGNKLWDRSFGGTLGEYLFVARPLPDGGFILGGHSASGANGNKTTVSFGGYDFWILQLDAAGNKLWEQSFGGTADDYCNALLNLADGGMIAVGGSFSGVNGNKTTPNFGQEDLWLVRLDASGNKLWERSYGGTLVDEARSVVERADGRLLVAGYSSSDASGNKSSPSFGSNDMWGLCLDVNGSAVWDRSFGGSSRDFAFSTAQQSDAGFVLAGFSASPVSGSKTSPNYGDFDCWVVKLATCEKPVGTPVALVNGQFYPSNAATLVTTAPVQIQIQTTFTNGTIRYTIDGSDPSGGAVYSAPFTVSNSVVVRAIAFNVDLSQAREADPVTVTILPCAPPGLVSWWPGEGNANDLVGGNNGILRNGTSFAPGVVGQGFSFDGIDDSVAMFPNPNLNLSNAVTLEAWVKHTVLGTMTQRYVTLGPEKAVLRYDGRSSPRFAFFIKVTGGVFYEVWPSITVQTNVLYHVVGTYDGAMLKLYINGSLAASRSASGPLDPMLTQWVVLSANPGEQLMGMIDEPAIYSRALSAEEILAHYTNGTLSQCVSPLIVADPQSVLAYAGGPVTFQVGTAGKSPVNYAWLFNETNVIATGTNASLVLPSVQLADAGGYCVVVSNAFGMATSAVAALTVLLPPTILAPPASQIAECGSDVTLSVEATSTDPLEYRWYFDGTNLLSDGPSASLTVSNAHFPHAGEYTVVLTNRLGSVSSASAILTVVDTTPPAISVCPPSRSVPADGSCMAVIPDLRGEVVASDVCGGVTVSQSPLPGLPAVLGPHTVTFTVTDESANSSICSAVVTVVDVTPPSITTCAPNEVLSANTNCQAAIPDLTGAVVAADHCGPLTVTQVPSAGTVVGLGSTNVTLTVTDGASNSVNCTATVTVVDTTPPTIATCASNVTLSADTNCQAAIPDLTGQAAASDNCSAVTVSQRPLAGTLVGLGVTNVTLTVTDAAGNETICTATITVNDTTAPVISVSPTNQTLVADGNCQAIVPDLRTGMVASDNCGPVTLEQTPAPGTVIGLGEVLATVTAWDGSSNTVTAHATVTVADMTPPTIVCPSNLVVTIPTTSESVVVNFEAPVVQDNCAGVTFECSPPSGSTFAAGTNTVVCVATDGAGNTNACSFTVWVNRAPSAGDDRMVAIENHSASVSLAAFLANDSDPDGRTLNITAVSPTSTNGGTVELAGTNIVFTPVPDFSGADRFTYTVSDDLGGTAVAAVAVDVVPETHPSYNRVARFSFSTARVSMSLLGIPGKTYTLERSQNLGQWTPVDSVRAPADGIVELADPNPPSGTAFYRTRGE